MDGCSDRDRCDDGADGGGDGDGDGDGGEGDGTRWVSGHGTPASKEQRTRTTRTRRARTKDEMMEVLTAVLSRLYTESLQCRPRVRAGLRWHELTRRYLAWRNMA